MPRAAMAAVRRRAEAIIESKPAWPDDHFQMIDPKRYTGHAGQELPYGIQRPAALDDTFSTVANHPNLVVAMRELLGGKVRRYTDQCGIKHGCVTEGGQTFYHQDSFYWHLEPDRGCNCWMPLSSVGWGASCLAMVPKSHKSGKLFEHESYLDDPPMGYLGDGFKREMSITPVDETALLSECGNTKFVPVRRHRIPSENIDTSKEIVIPMEPGDALFFTNYTVHRSEPNRTGNTLCFYGVAYELDREVSRMSKDTNSSSKL